MKNTQEKLNEVKLFLDSGAYSAWTQNSEVNIDEYIEFALKNIDMFEVVANLDVIPGSPYQRLTQSCIENSAAKGWQNYEYMLSKGVPKDKLLHVFHQGEDMKWLKRMVKEIPYIGISPGNDRTTKEKMEWLDECMKYATDANGMPLVKFHGFGVTSHKLLLRYPWYSVDSTSWLRIGMYGGILVPYFRDGKWQYDEPPWKISVSSKSPDKSKSGFHIDSISPRQKQLVLDYIAEKGFVLGRSSYKMVRLDYELKENEEFVSGKVKEGDTQREVEIIEKRGLCNDYKLRNEISCAYYLNLQRHLPRWPWAFKSCEIIPRLL